MLAWTGDCRPLEEIDTEVAALRKLTTGWARTRPPAGVVKQWRRWARARWYATQRPTPRRLQRERDTWRELHATLSRYNLAGTSLDPRATHPDNMPVARLWTKSYRAFLEKERSG